MTTHSFVLGGTRQVYHVEGRGPVMIAHSGGPGVEYTYLRSAKLEEHFTMVYVEPIGTGDSQPFPEGATYVDTYVDHLHSIVERLDVPQVYLLGHSHGGVVAQRFAVRHPGRVAGLALYSSTPVTDPDFWAAARAEAAAYPVHFPYVDEAMTVAAAFGSETASMREVLPIYFADYWGRRAEFEPLRDGLRTWTVEFDSKEVDYRPDLPSITAPTVVLTGRHDFICGPRWARMLHEGIAGSRLVILEHSGHFAQIEEPEAFLEAVTWLLGARFEHEVRATFRRGDSEGVLRLARAEIDRARAAGEPAGEVEGLYATARVALRGGDLGRAEQLAREALDVAVRSLDPRLEERPRHVLAAVARMSGDYPVARERYLASIALNEALGQPEQVNSESYNLAVVELKMGHLDRARELLAQCRERVFREGRLSFVPYLGVAAAAMATAEGDHAGAARMIGFTDGAYAAVGQVPDPDDAEELAHARTAALTALGEEKFAGEYAAGAALDAAEALKGV
ncbi:alpha/beta fold hydrolase [Paractinoplanes atraurantiacus]|uniref:Pimeloyl-ACP methyl ester carboxylesterase n=1 Tax=Paractinoplanes atraurantiacus TaxID=1036182 RepID=A0A285GS71_9ACTN|nr:alpha/beta fold hydrolase [Actinoplanes atraurantiacus]SNY26123.1 Pimeloyl-ACP methyl ester carboxylesterase [Actinoplanes atraurantiacus]